jgi:hypothetical protein
LFLPSISSTPLSSPFWSIIFINFVNT